MNKTFFIFVTSLLVSCHWSIESQTDLLPFQFINTIIVAGFNSDIICLQEVDRKIYDHDLLPSLSMLNYDGVYVTKNEISEGLAMFFNERFEMLKVESSVMSHGIDFPKFNAVWTKIENEKVKQRFLSRNTTIQVGSARFIRVIDT